MTQTGAVGELRIMRIYTLVDRLVTCIAKRVWSTNTHDDIQAHSWNDVGVSCYGIQRYLAILKSIDQSSAFSKETN
jgi:hypothetical protein